MKKKAAEKQADGQVLMDHIRELRTRLVVVAVVLVVGGVVGYLFYTPILEWLRSPLGQSLYYSTPAGSFNFIIKVASMVGILAAVPFLVFQLIMFVQPVFKEKLSSARIVGYSLASILLAITGGAFAFYAILPGALKFFAGFQIAGVSALIDANNYLNFVINAIVTFIIVFQIPLLMIIIDRIAPISPKKLFAAEKYVVLGGLIVSLLVPFALDITTSLLIASPIVILYNLSVLMIITRHAVLGKKPAALPVVQPLTAQQVEMDDQLVTEFFAQSTQQPIVEAFQAPAVVQPPAVQTVLHRNIGVPLHQKPRPGSVDIDRLHAEAKARRDQQIAERVAIYNRSSPMRAINDIR